MIYKHNFTLPEELAADIADQGFEFLPKLLRLVIYAAMQKDWLASLFQLHTGVLSEPPIRLNG